MTQEEILNDPTIALVKRAEDRGDHVLEIFLWTPESGDYSAKSRNTTKYMVNGADTDINLVKWINQSKTPIYYRMKWDESSHEAIMEARIAEMNFITF